MRPLFVTQRLVRAEHYEEERDALDVRWSLFLREAGLLPIPVPSSVDLPPFLATIGNAAGLLLTGGNDLAAVSNDPLSRRRDAMEHAMCAAMEAQGKPILGVCRGLQLLAQRAGETITRVSGHAGGRHPLVVSAESRWLVRHRGYEANSYHDFGLRTIATSLRVAAKAPDDTIEALEWDDRAMLGIMWHPEREASFREADVRLFAEFFV